MNFTRSYLEIFPDELFLELFSYISPVDLYSVWFGQNRRFNAILRSVRISFDLFEKSPLVSQALKHFADQIVYLHFRVSDPNFDFRHFPKIRSLHIDSALTKEQLESIHPHILPSLERVTFSAYLPETDWFSEQILLRHSQVEQKKKWIEVYRLPRLPSTLKKSPERFSHIHSIIIDRATMNDVDLLLFLFTSLRRLKVTIVPRSIERLKIPMRCMEKPLFTHPLLHLHITMNTFDKLDEFYPLLARLASLKSLYIACDNLSMIDFQQLAIALHRDAPALRTFNCSFQQTYFEDMSQIHNLSPLFRRMKCQRVDLCGGWYYHCITTQGR